MKIVFDALLEEAENPEFRPWHTVLHHLALLHENSIYEIETCPAPYPLETLGPGYYFAPAFGHWDLIFALLDSCPVMPEHTLRQLKNMLSFQQSDGFLPGAIFFRSNGEETVIPHWYSGFPPIWPLAADEYDRITGSNVAAKLCLDPLIRQIHWYEQNRVADGFGFYYQDMVEPKSWESGVDESIRCEVVQERGKFPCIDATCHLRLLYDAAARWSAQLGRDAAEFIQKREELDSIVQTHFYAEETGFFHDAFLLERDFKYRTLNGVWALTCGAASPEQAHRVIEESLLNPERFFTEHPLPFVAVNEPFFELKMWRGASWNSLTYMAVLGCLRFGRKDAAVKIAERALHWSQVYYNKTGAVWEFYHPQAKSSPSAMARKRAPWLLPCREYLGHNPLFALARVVCG